MTNAVVYTLLFMVVTMIWVPSQSYEIHKSEDVRWQLIFLSRYSGCTNYQYQMTNMYDEVTSKYFELYKFANSKYQPKCMPDKKYSHYKIPDDLDLLILVYDYEIGRKELNANNLGGIYNHVGTDRTRNHTIIICDCPNFKFSDPVWILSHELSHFITYYLGFDKSVVEDVIHARDNKYDTCVEIHYEQSCSGIKVHIRGDYYFSYATVMAPYAPAVGKKLIPLSNIQNDSAKLAIVMDIEKQITKW